MPCWTIQTTTVELELKAENQAHLKAALESMGYRVQANEQNQTLTFQNRNGTLNGSFVDGKLKLDGRDSEVANFDINAVKRAYSTQVVKSQAKKFGWEIKQKDPLKLKYVVQKKS